MTSIPEATSGRHVTDWVLVRHRAATRFGHVLLYALLVLGGLIFSAPLLWMVSTALKPPNMAMEIPIVWIPTRIDLSNFVKPWQLLPFVAFFRNTAFIALVNVFGLLLSSSLVAFGFARIPFRGRNVIFLLLLSTMMLPDQVTLIPLYIFWANLGLVNTYWPLIVPQWLSTGINVFLLRQFFMTINLELDDAARIDGANWFMIYWRILLPLSKPALGVVAIQAFAWNWNNFMDPLIYLNDTRKYTVSIGLRLFQTVEYNLITQVMAMTLIALIPMLVVFYIGQARFVRGIVITGVKG